MIGGKSSKRIGPLHWLKGLRYAVRISAIGLEPGEPSIAKYKEQLTHPVDPWLLTWVWIVNRPRILAGKTLEFLTDCCMIKLEF
jgi:hypothetical protein